MLNMSELEIVIQALFNEGNSFGGSTKLALHGVAKEIKRLKRVQEEQESRDKVRMLLMEAEERKMRGEPNLDDDIPF